METSGLSPLVLSSFRPPISIMIKGKGNLNLLGGIFSKAHGQGCFLCLALSSPKTIYGQILRNAWRATEKKLHFF